jgi:hypothetical protein
MLLRVDYELEASELVRVQSDAASCRSAIHVSAFLYMTVQSAAAILHLLTYSMEQSPS